MYGNFLFGRFWVQNIFGYNFRLILKLNQTDTKRVKSSFFSFKPTSFNNWQWYITKSYIIAVLLIFLISLACILMHFTVAVLVDEYIYQKM